MHDTNLLEDQPIAWTPTPEVIERAQLTRFMRQVGVTTWDELYEFSIRDVERFTEEVLKFLDIKFDPPYEKLMDVTEGVEFPRWFSTNAERGMGNAESDVETRRQESVPPAIAGRPSDLGSGISDLGFRDAESNVERRRQESVPPAVAGGSPAVESTTRATAGLNITTMCLDRWQTDEMKDQPAVIWDGEDAKVEVLTYADLLDNVESCAAGLRLRGFGKGDAV